MDMFEVGDIVTIRPELFKNSGGFPHTVSHGQKYLVIEVYSGHNSQQIITIIEDDGQAWRWGGSVWEKVI